MPLYSGGLCEAVMHTDASHPSWEPAYTMVGVGANPTSITLHPPDRMPATMARLMASAEVRWSVPTATLPLLSSDAASAIPVLRTRGGVISRLTIPRMPEVPKSAPIAWVESSNPFMFNTWTAATGSAL